MAKDPTVRLSSKADLKLSNLKHEALIKRKRRVYKGQILDWVVLHALDEAAVKEKFWKWVEQQKAEF